MFAEARRQVILRRMARDGEVTVAELAREWGLSRMTVRRDLTELEQQGRLRRTYGGAVPVRAEDAAAPRVGLLLPHNEYYYGRVVAGAERAAEELGCRLVLAAHFYDGSLEHDRLSKLAQLSLDGLVMASSGAGPPPQLAADAIVDRLALPIVLVEREPRRAGERTPDSVRTAHDQGARMAVEHLHQLGHDRLLTLLTPSATSSHLRRGVAETVAELGMDWSDHPTTEWGDPAGPVAALADQCVSQSVRAVFIHTDIQALNFVEALAKRGVDVPADMHLITYDDELASNCRIPLTAVAPPKEELGFEAVRMVLQRLTAKDSPVSRQLFLMPRLVVRESTRPNSPV
ncbi:LacI family DNA-binding transcriptional regulator [Propionibacteriaceae bacterium Y2011]